MVLASAYAGWAGSLPAAVVAERLETGLRDLETEPSRLAESFLATLFSDDVDGEKADVVAAMLAELHPAGARVMLRAMAECDLRDMLPSIDVPTLLLYGERDVRSPLSIGEQLHAAIRGSILTVLSGAGHQCNVEAPGSFTAEVRAFLRANHAL
jgi:pimeloyl-ACP methyl ester carboxylesterase